MNEGDRMTNLRLQMILYYAQSYSLSAFDQPLFLDAIEAWQLGPVVPAVYHEYQQYGDSALPCVIYDENNISDNEIELLLDTWRACEGFSTERLITLSCRKGSPWDCVYSRNHNAVIPNELIRACFMEHPFVQRTERQLKYDLFIPERDESGMPVFPAEMADDWV